MCQSRNLATTTCRGWESYPDTPTRLFQTRLQTTSERPNSFTGKGKKRPPSNRLWLARRCNRASKAGCRGIVLLPEIGGRTFRVKKRKHILSTHITKTSENVSRYNCNDVKDGATTRSDSKSVSTEIKYIFYVAIWELYHYNNVVENDNIIKGSHFG